MPYTDLSPLFSLQSFFYSLTVPMAVVMLLALVLTPSLLKGTAKAQGVAQAFYVYLMLGVGVLLMTIGALPTIHSVLSKVPHAGETYIGLLVVFATGGAIFLWFDNEARSLDAVSKSVPQALYYYTFKILGHLFALFSGLSLGLMIILGATNVPGWWVSSVTMLLYSLLLIWCTRGEKTIKSPSVFQSTQMTTSASSMKTRPIASAPKKATAKKASTKKSSRKKRK